jgi:hypothetical protein
VLVQPFLGRLVVVGRDQQAGADAEIAGQRGEFDCFRVALPPVPAITGMRPATAATVWRITSRCSSTLSVALSPVVPTDTIAAVPLA